MSCRKCGSENTKMLVGERLKCNDCGFLDCLIDD